MAGKDIKAMIAAYRDHDDLAFRRAVLQIIDEEESKKHATLARDLRKLLTSGAQYSPPTAPAPKPSPPIDRETNLPLIDILRPDLYLNDLVLLDDLRSELISFVREVSMWNELDAANIPRRRSILFYGPPGCGKTSIASALASELSRPLAIVRTDSVISSFLGETASNLAQVFDFASSGPYVVLFDEFDSLGKSRSDETEHGELRRVVNSVLQFIDRYSGPSLLVAATNHHDVLDSALWRRFSEVFETPLPDNEQRIAILARKLIGKTSEDLCLHAVAGKLENFPHAAVERVAVDALRNSFLHERSSVSCEDVSYGLERTLRRRWI